jgi:hypothetical protein
VYWTDRRATIKRTAGKAKRPLGWLALVVLLLVAPASAQAAGWRAHAREVAERTFRTPACGEPEIIRRDPLTYAPEQADALRAATAWADPERCAIVLNRNERIHTSWRFCHIVTHEWGHLVLGGDEAHSDDPADVMFPYVLGVEGKIKRRGRWRWTADGYWPSCEPPTITRRGREVIGGSTI